MNEDLWAGHDGEWRDAAQVTSLWEDAAHVDPKLLSSRARGAFWEILDEAGVTLLVTREYEHLVMALTVLAGRPFVTYMRIPHPSGLAFDRKRRVVQIASTRNPNQIVELVPVAKLKRREDVKLARLKGRPLVPTASRFYPGCTYLHDLAFIAGKLHANAVGENAVVRVESDGTLHRVWWPRCIETRAGPVFDENHIQLNSIGAGRSLRDSFFTASSDALSRRRPGHRNFAADGRGVVFSGKTREPIVRGLTRPHSARMHRGRLWLANSGYGELGFVEGGRFASVHRLDGWTRGLGFAGDVAFVGTSRVIPRFSRYAPGLHIEKSRCGIHAVETRSGRVLGSLFWPGGNQIFAVEAIPRRFASGFALSVGERSGSERTRRLFYAFETPGGRRG